MKVGLVSFNHKIVNFLQIKMEKNKLNGTEKILPEPNRSTDSKNEDEKVTMVHFKF